MSIGALRALEVAVLDQGHAGLVAAARVVVRTHGRDQGNGFGSGGHVPWNMLSRAAVGKRH